MRCEPGTVLNPLTLRCVRLTGKVGKELYKQGYVRNAELAQGLPYARQTRRIPKPKRLAEPCPYGYERNPATGYCVKYGGKTHRKVHRYVERIRTASDEEDRDVIPTGKSGAAPIADKQTIMGWTQRNCKYANDVITGKPFASSSQLDLQGLVRLHDGSCAAAPALNTHVIQQQKIGAIPTLPHDRSSHMTKGDFDSLRETMRRGAPGYKLPARAHKPPPPEWQLYAASDYRSGSEFVSVLYVDVTKAKKGAFGIEYPLESIRVDMGFLPTHAGPQSIQPILAQMQRLAAKNKLLAPVAGGWKPVGGFPFSKKHWAQDRVENLNRLYRNLVSLD